MPHRGPWGRLKPHKRSCHPGASSGLCYAIALSMTGNRSWMRFSGLLHFPKSLQKTLCFKDHLMVLPEHMLNPSCMRGLAQVLRVKGASPLRLILLYHKDHSLVASGLELLQDLLHAEPVAALQGTTTPCCPQPSAPHTARAAAPPAPGGQQHCTGHTSLCSYLSFSNLRIVVTRPLNKTAHQWKTQCAP